MYKFLFVLLVVSWIYGHSGYAVTHPSKLRHGGAPVCQSVFPYSILLDIARLKGDKDTFLWALWSLTRLLLLHTGSWYFTFNSNMFQI